MLLSFEICRNRSPRFAYYRFVSITKDFVKVYALIFCISARGLNLSKYLTSNKTCDENHFVSTFKCQLPALPHTSFLLLKMLASDVFAKLTFLCNFNS